MMNKLVEKYKNLNKYIKIALFVIAVACFIFSLVRVEKNKLFIKNYNFGNKAFKAGEYEEAEYRYGESLYYRPTKRKECKVRINYALSIVTPITPESVTYENLEESIARLNEAKNILIENDCAHDYDTNGHNKKAQTLKNEIDDYIDWLKENVKPPEEENKEENKNSDGDNKDNQQQSGNDEEQSAAQQKENELRDLIEQGQKEGQEERFLDSEYFANWDSFSFYDGQNW